ncbi:STAS domain-containing protein [Streptomyces sp. NPDC047014]|uniref:STAS domain-containing protein n=1 Tax=Streptomyces sp. NPDC047014 TaxID=3155736 RepID=UPI0033D63A00
MITVDVQHYGSSVLVTAGGELDERGGAALGEALDTVALEARDLLVDLHGVPLMDPRGLLHLLEVHRRAECLGLRVLVTGFQPQPQQCMAEIAGISGTGSATGERYPVAGFRRLLEERAHALRDGADFAAGWLPGA